MSVGSVRLNTLSAYPWHVEPVKGGTIYWDSDPSPQVQTAVELLRGIATGETSFKSLEALGQGTSATVRRAGDLAVKHFGIHNPPYVPGESGLPYLQVSDGLHHGLIHIQDEIPQKYRERSGVTFTYAAPRFYGGFSPSRPYSRYRRPFSIMELANGDPLGSPDIPRPPNLFRRFKVYNMALAAAGLKNSLAFDVRPQNTLIQPHSEDKATLTRLDAISDTYYLRTFNN